MYAQDKDYNRAFTFAMQALLLDMSIKACAPVMIMAEKSEDPLKIEFYRKVYKELQNKTSNNALAMKYLRIAGERKDAALESLLKAYIKKQFG